MINITNSEKELITRDNAKKNLIVSFPFQDHDEITNADIVSESFKLSDQLCGGDAVKFGQSSSKRISFETVGVDDIANKVVDVAMKFTSESKSTLKTKTLTVSATATTSDVYQIVEKFEFDLLAGGNYKIIVPSIPEYVQTGMMSTIGYVDCERAMSSDLYLGNDFSVNPYADGKMTIYIEFDVSLNAGETKSYDFVLETTNDSIFYSHDTEECTLNLGRFKVESAKVKDFEINKREIVAYDDIVPVSDYCDSSISYFIQNAKYYANNTMQMPLEFLKDNIFGGEYTKTLATTYPSHGIIYETNVNTSYRYNSHDCIFRVSGNKITYDNSDITISTNQTTCIKNIEVWITGIGKSRADYINKFYNTIAEMKDKGVLGNYSYDKNLDDYLYPVIVETRPSSFYTASTKLPVSETVKKHMYVDGIYRTGTYYESIKVSSTNRICSSTAAIYVPDAIEFGYYNGSTWVNLYDVTYFNGTLEEFDVGIAKLKKTISTDSSWIFTDVNDGSSTSLTETMRDFAIERGTQVKTTFTDGTTRTDYGSNDNNMLYELSSEDIAKYIAELFVGFIKFDKGIPYLKRFESNWDSDIDKSRYMSANSDDERYCAYNGLIWNYRSIGDSSIELNNMDYSRLEKNDPVNLYDLTDNAIQNKFIGWVSGGYNMFKNFINPFFEDINKHYKPLDFESIGMPWYEVGDEFAVDGNSYYIVSRDMTGIQHLTDNFISK